MVGNVHYWGDPYFNSSTVCLVTNQMTLLYHNHYLVTTLSYNTIVLYIRDIEGVGAIHDII